MSFYNVFQNLRRSEDLKKIIRLKVDKEFKKIKADIIKSFDNHLVTREIEAGIHSQNISETLMGLEGANLFSFIGFKADSDPTKVIREMLMSSDYKLNFIGVSAFSVNIKFNIPEAKDIFHATPMPWPFSGGRSWARGIETGISGLNWYLRVESASSRSGYGLQAKKEVRNFYRFKPTQYISSLISDFNKRLDKIII